LGANGGDAEKVLAQFAKAGIDVDALATQLQDDRREVVRQVMGRADECDRAKSAVIRKRAKTARSFRMMYWSLMSAATHVKVLASGENGASQIRLRPTLTPGAWFPAFRRLPVTGL